jgi:hypothetical protein
MAPMSTCDYLVGDLRLAICLQVEGRAGVEACADETKQLAPQVAGEDRIPIAHNGGRNAVKSDDVVEECLAHRLR